MKKGRVHPVDIVTGIGLFLIPSIASPARTQLPQSKATKPLVVHQASVGTAPVQMFNPTDQIFAAPANAAVKKLPEKQDTQIYGPQIQKFLSKLSNAAKYHGVWIGMGNQVLGDHQGSTPLSAASLTKVATTLAVLSKKGVTPQLVKRIVNMNDPSDNDIAESLAKSVGGAKAVDQIVGDLTGLPDEITLYTGSGLPSVLNGQRVENVISPRAVCSMFGIIQNKAEAAGYKITDLFPSVGQGTLTHRSLPKGTVGKTGTLSNASALAGFLRKDGNQLCFAIIDEGYDIDLLRKQQENLVKSL